MPTVQDGGYTLPVSKDREIAKPMMEEAIREHEAIEKELEKDNWRHRSAIMKCRTCMWYAPKQGTIGRCRRRSPTMNGFPVMFETDWCGDHKIDETAL